MLRSPDVDIGESLAENHQLVLERPAGF